MAVRVADAYIEVHAETRGALRDIGRLGSHAQPIVVPINGNTSGIQQSLNGLQQSSQQSGRRAGNSLGHGITSGLGSLATAGGPIVGTILGAVGVAGVAAGGLFAAGFSKSIGAAMDAQNAQAKLVAGAGMSKEQAAKIGQAAGQAYANNFGESIASNMDTAKQAVQAGLLDPDATRGQVQQIVSSLSGISDIIGVEIPDLTRAASQLVRTGLAKDAAGAFDIITKASQSGLDVSGDLLDTVTEYSTQFRKLGIDGGTAFGLISQLVKGGARDTDLAADAFKEFSIRVVDGSKTTADAYSSLGFSVDDMTARFAAGGDKAKTATTDILAALQNIQDPVEKNRIGLELFGTQWEDLGGAVNSIDFSKANAEWSNLGGTADKAISDVGSTASARIETARRTIETAATSIGAAFGQMALPALEAVATWVSQHQADIVGFGKSLGEAFFDAAELVLQFASASYDMSGKVIGAFTTVTTGALSMAESIVGALDATVGWVPGFGEKIDQAKTKLGELKDTVSINGTLLSGSLQAASTVIDEKMLPGLANARVKFDELATSAEKQAAISDQANIVSASIGKITASTDLASTAVNRTTGEINLQTEAGRKLDEKIRAATDAITNQTAAQQSAGTETSELTGTYNTNRDSLIQSITQMGLSKAAAERLVAAYGLVPAIKTTAVSAPGIEGTITRVGDLQRTIATLSDKTISIRTNYIDNSAGSNGSGTGNLRRTGGGNYRAAGGPIWGAGTSTSDSIPAWLSNGEYVVKASSVSKYGMDFMHNLNAGKFATGGAITVNQPSNASIGAGYSGLIAAADKKIQAQAAAAGYIGTGGNAGIKQFIKSVDALPYIWGATGPRGYDCSGLAGAVMARMTGRNPYARYFTTGSFGNGRQFGFKPGPGGTLTLGFSSGHVVGNYGGLGFEARSTKTGIFTGGAAKSPLSMPRVYHLARGGAVDAGFGPNLQQLMRQGMDIAGDPGDTLIDNKLLRVYDKGGMLNPGEMAVNLSNKPERILTGKQTDTYDRIANGVSSGGSPLVGSLVIQSSGDTRADLDEALFQLRRISRGGVHGRR